MSDNKIPEHEIRAQAKRMNIFSLQIVDFARIIEEATARRVREKLSAEVSELMNDLATTMKSISELKAASIALHEQLERIVAEVDVDTQHAAYYRYLRDQHPRVTYTTDVEGRTPGARMLDGIRKAGVVNTDLIRIDLPCYHLGPTDEPIWKKGVHFDYAANMDASIAAAISKGTTR